MWWSCEIWRLTEDATQNDRRQTSEIDYRQQQLVDGACDFVWFRGKSTETWDAKHENN